MRRTLRALAALVTAALLLSLAAFAADFTPLADELNVMNMFRGTDKGYQLDNNLTREQAAVMLVRLLGQEKNAEADYAAGKITHPYVDAKAAWLAPSVAYLYANGLTNGMGVNAAKQPVFGYGTACSAQMYCTFLLRALGYTDLGAAPDFSYAGALDYAFGKGLIDASLTGGAFVRDRAVATAYQALGTSVKGASTLLLEKLIATGAVDKTAAADSLAKMKAWQAVSAATRALSAQRDFDVTAQLELKLGAPLNTETTMTVMTQYVGGDKPQYACMVGVKGVNTELYGGQWYRDGVTYTLDTAGNATKKRDAAVLETAETLLSGMQDQEERLYMYDGFDVSQDGNTYVFRMAPGYYGLAQELVADQLKQLGLEAACAVKSADVYAQLTADGSMENSLTSIGLDLTINGQTFPATCDIYLLINAVGDKVVVEYPDDLASFTEVQ